MFNTKEISYDLRDEYIMHILRFNKIKRESDVHMIFLFQIENAPLIYWQSPNGTKSTKWDTFHKYINLLEMWEISFVDAAMSRD